MYYSAISVDSIPFPVFFTSCIALTPLFITYCMSHCPCPSVFFPHVMFLSHLPVAPPWIHSRAWNRISCSTDLLQDIWLCCWLIEALNLEHYQMADVHPEVCETSWWQRPDCLLVSADHCQRCEAWAGEGPTWEQNKRVLLTFLSLHYFFNR